MPPNPQSDQIMDPRSRHDFRPEYYPTANGEPAPSPDATQRNERIKIEFLTVYYDLNCLYGQLLDARKTVGFSERKAAERNTLQAVERLLIFRDTLEDRYAPMGVIADPVVDRGFTKDIQFSFGDVDAAGQRRSELYTISAYVPVPIPEHTRFADLPMRIVGPGFYTPQPGDDA